MIDLALEHLATVRRLLVAHVPECEVRAFGSRVAWTAKSYSDLDLALVGPEKLDPTRLHRLREAFEESELPIRVDVLDWHAISESFQKIISELFEVIQQPARVNPGRGEWCDITLGELGRIVTGKTPTTADEGNFGGQIPFVTPSDMDGRRTISTTARYLTEDGAASVKSAKIPAGSVMVSCIGSDMGKAVIAGRDCVTNQQINSIVVDSRFSSEFVYYNLSTRKDEIRHQAAGGSAQPILNKSDFSRLEMSHPPLAEQKAIAAVLGALDDKIELNRRMNATLEAMARALFQSWFVDFDPVRAKLDGHQPVGLDPATAALFPAHFQDSEVGHIPKGWIIKPVGEVVDCVGGGTPSTAEPKYWEGGTYHWTTPKDFSSLQAPVLLATDRKLTDAGIAKISSGLLPAGTLLLSSRAPVGYLAIAAMPVAINQGFIALKCNERASNFFMLNWCQTNMAEIESRATGTTFAEISKQNFRPIRVVLPSKELMAAFTAKVAPLYTQITANLQQSRILATLRDTLLPKLLNGELSVEEIQREVST